MAKQYDINPNTLIVAGTAIFGIIVAKNILKKFGLLGGKGEKKLNDEIQDPNSPWKPLFWKRQPALILTRATADSFSKTIYDALNWYADDTAKVMAVFSSLKTQSQVSYLAEIFLQKYNLDLLTYLYEGSDTVPWNGLSDDELLKITTLVDRLPQYKQR